MGFKRKLCPRIDMASSGSASQNTAPAFLAVVVGKGSIAYMRDDDVAVIPMAAFGA